MQICIYVILSVYDPKATFLRKQFASIADQSYENVRVVFVDADRKSSHLITVEAERVGLDFEIVTPKEKLDAVRAFETGLRAAFEQSKQTDYFALADQDDIWHQDKLEISINALKSRGADLVHGDARLVDEDENIISQSVFIKENRQKNPTLRNLLFRNTITGMTSLFTHDVVEVALPFPPQYGVHYYHDLWLGLVAASLRGISYVDRPLVDYRQHSDNVIGAIERQPMRLPKFSMAWLRRKTASFALARYLAKSLEYRLNSSNLSGKNKNLALKKLKPFLNCGLSSFTLIKDSALLLLNGKSEQARIAASFAIVSIGRSVWAARQAVFYGIPQALDSFDQRAYQLSPGLAPVAKTMPNHELVEVGSNWKSSIDVRTKPKWKPIFSSDAASLNILLPTVNPTEMFAGITTAIDIGLAVARIGVGVRFIPCDLPVSSASATREFILSRTSSNEREAISRLIQVECGVTSKQIPVNQGDRFLATAWWTAHIADHIVRSQPFLDEKFYYLIQDFEPNFYAWGAEFAQADASYRLNFEPVFNTVMLREYFSQMGFVFANSDALTFRPSIDLPAYNILPRVTQKGVCHIAVYGRPEVPRNMFPTAIEALGKFLETQPASNKYRLSSVGMKHPSISLPGDRKLKSLGKLPLENYPAFLASVDIGISLMYSPHPSHLPIEMAASGVKVITNNFGPKDLSVLTPLITSVEPTADAISSALARSCKPSVHPPEARQFNLDILGSDLDIVAHTLAHRLMGSETLTEKATE